MLRQSTKIHLNNQFWMHQISLTNFTHHCKQYINIESSSVHSVLQEDYVMKVTLFDPIIYFIVLFVLQLKLEFKRIILRIYS